MTEVFDLDAERAESRRRREEADAERWLEYRSRRLRTEGDEISVEAARKFWPSKSEEDLRKIVERAWSDLEDRNVVTGDTLSAQEMVELGAELLEEHPAATARQIYALLVEAAGERQLALTGNSWINGYATKARRLVRQRAGPATDVAGTGDGLPGDGSIPPPPTSSAEVEKPATPAEPEADRRGIEEAAAPAPDEPGPARTAPFLFLEDGPVWLAAEEIEDGRWTVDLHIVADRTQLARLMREVLKT